MHGHKTTEFWVTIATLVAVVAGWVEAKTEYGEMVCMIAGAIAAAAYSISRAMAKKGASNATNGDVRDQVLSVLAGMRGGPIANGLHQPPAGPAGDGASADPR